MTSIEKLLALVDEFPIRRRIEYDRAADRVFCNTVLRALKEAAPAIRALLATIPPPAPADACGPSSDALPSPQKDSSTHNPEASPNTAGNASTSDQIANTGNTAASSGAKPVAVQTAEGAHKAPSPATPRRSPKKKGRAALPPPPLATPETGPASTP